MQHYIPSNTQDMRSEKKVYNSLRLTHAHPTPFHFKQRKTSYKYIYISQVFMSVTQLKEIMHKSDKHSKGMYKCNTGVQYSEVVSQQCTHVYSYDKN